MARKVIVIGGSTGGIQSLCTILKNLPSNLDSPVLAVIHTGEGSQYLGNVVQRCGGMKVIRSEKAEPIEAGKIYLAAPNRHLMVNSHCAISWMGPRENRHRPSVDALFRTAARTYRRHVIAVILSGALDDGTAGALAVKARGGTVIVQDPDEAFVKDMPANVMRQVETDYCLPLAKIPALLVKLSSEGRQIKSPKPTAKECERLSHVVFHEMEPTGYSCPDCDGVLMKIGNGKKTQFRCHVGHAFSLNSFTAAHADALERALWVALRKLNEQQSIQENLALETDKTNPLRKRHQENADSAKYDMRLLHEILGRL
jgi:two-component system, chemotaxis family, protein-glutamate methylesterase/glutaminase